MIDRVAGLSAPLREALKQLIQCRGDGAVRRNVEDILEWRERGLKLLIEALLGKLLLHRGIRKGITRVLGLFHHPARQAVLRLEVFSLEGGYLSGVAGTVGVGDVVL